MHLAHNERASSNAVNGALIAWSAAQLLTGGLYLTEAWGLIAMISGLLLLPVAVYGLAQGKWFVPLVFAQIFLAVGLLTAAVIFSSLLAGLAGLLSLVLTMSSVKLVLVIRDRPIAQTSAYAGGVSRSSVDSHGLAELHQSMRELLDVSSLSEQARKVLFRTRDLSAVQQAIQESIGRGDHAEAERLCDDLAHTFSELELADRFRTAIASASQRVSDDQMHADLSKYEQLLAMHDWQTAETFSHELHNRYGDAIVEANLAERLTAAQREHKQSLEQQFLHAAASDDIAEAMSLLKTLDQYLTRDEALRLNEVAQQVVAKHRDHLGQLFRSAVNEHRWAEAAATGQTIIDEFPNTKMAQEVRTMIDLIRTRATEAAIATRSS